MTNEIITLDVRANTIIVTDGQMKDSKLCYQADGLDIYVHGKVCRCKEHKVTYQATLEVQARHIPVRSMKGVREQRKSKTEPKNPHQRSMF